MASIEAIEAGHAPPTQAILHSPSRLTAAEIVFLRGLHHHGRLSAVLTGSPDDAFGWLQEVTGEVTTEPSKPAYEDIPLNEVLASEMHLTVAPDAEEEVRLVVRAVLAHLDETTCRPERIGIAFRASNPYARLLREQLKAAGVPHHVPSQRTLDQTIAGRVALGLLELQLHDFPRADVIRWLSDGPLVDADGRPLPADWWDRLSREAGVARGADTWAERLELYAADQERRAAGLTAEETKQVEGLQARAAESRALARFVVSAAAASEQIVNATSWVDVALTICSLAAAAELDDAVGAPTPSSVLDALRTELDRSVSSGTTLGRGVLVGPFSQFVGSDIDLLCVVGMTEDSFPPRTREHAILRDADRTLMSDQLRTVAARRSDERERWLAVLHSARVIGLSYPRADTRSQRRQFAAPWFLEQATRLNGGDLVGASHVSYTHLR